MHERQLRWLKSSFPQSMDALFAAEATAFFSSSVMSGFVIDGRAVCGFRRRFLFHDTVVGCRVRDGEASLDRQEFVLAVCSNAPFMAAFPWCGGRTLGQPALPGYLKQPPKLDEPF